MSAHYKEFDSLLPLPSDYIFSEKEHKLKELENLSLKLKLWLKKKKRKLRIYKVSENDLDSAMIELN